MDKILIVDDAPANIKILGELLKANYHVLVTNNGSKAVQIAQDTLPDLILLDVVMPEMDGFTACEILKSTSATAEIPIIFITAKNEAEDVINGFAVGGVDYITKPFNPAEVHARVRTHITLRKQQEVLKLYATQMEELNKELQSKNTALNQAYEELRILAMTDPLTGLANRRHMMDMIKQEVARCKRSSRPFSFVLGDIDNFKHINDTLGHECGDYVLKQVAQLMTAAVREQDVICRWGGEEFLLMLIDTDLEGAAVVAEKIRSVIADTLLEYEEKRIPVTMTFGVAPFNMDWGIDCSIKKADNALYIGKSQGKNCVVNSRDS